MAHFLSPSFLDSLSVDILLDNKGKDWPVDNLCVPHQEFHVAGPSQPSTSRALRTPAILRSILAGVSRREMAVAARVCS